MIGPELDRPVVQDLRVGLVEIDVEDDQGVLRVAGGKDLHALVDSRTAAFVRHPRDRARKRRIDGDRLLVAVVCRIGSEVVLHATRRFGRIRRTKRKRGVVREVVSRAGPEFRDFFDEPEIRHVFGNEVGMHCTRGGRPQDREKRDPYEGHPVALAGSHSSLPLAAVGSTAHRLDAALGNGPRPQKYIHGPEPYSR